MKKFENLGKMLSKTEQKKIIGGDYEPPYCAHVTCKDSQQNELGSIYAWSNTMTTWITQCRVSYPDTTNTGGSNCFCSNCQA